MTREKEQETNGITISCFLYDSLWCIVYYACQVNPGHVFTMKWFDIYRFLTISASLMRKQHIEYAFEKLFSNSFNQNRRWDQKYIFWQKQIEKYISILFLKQLASERESWKTPILFLNQKIGLIRILKLTQDHANIHSADRYPKF